MMIITMMKLVHWANALCKRGQLQKTFLGNHVSDDNDAGDDADDDCDDDCTDHDDDDDDDDDKYDDIDDDDD